VILERCSVPSKMIFVVVHSTEEDAEIRCKENLDLAVDTDPDNAEAYHTMASYWLSKDDKQVY